MEGRYPNGQVIALTRCTDPSREEEFNYWYNYIHIPDGSADGIFRHGMRFINTDPNPEGGKYLFTCETDWDDLSAAWTIHRENVSKMGDPERAHPSYVEGMVVGVFKRLGGEYRSANRPCRGILFALVNPTDSTTDKELSRWYTDVHIPDILDTGLYHTAYWYESLDPKATKGKYMALFETDQSDPAKALVELQKLAPNWESRGRLFSGQDTPVRMTARRIWPMD